MTLKNVSQMITGGLLMGGLAVVAPARAVAQDATVLPDKAKSIVLVGCFERRDNEHHKSKYVIVNPTVGYATSVPDGHCTSAASASFLELDDMHHTTLDDSMLGQWIEVRGKLKKQPGGDDFRELELTVARLVPVVPPPVAVIMPVAPEQPQAQIETPAAPLTAAPTETPAPIATAGVQEAKKLPKTASPLAFIGLLGFLSLAGGLGLRFLRQRSC
jgi:hypothetical protein